MDEILIEDKRYVSSKRAAKVTGYAKDYIGQLCREGRVPARLVGRSWYVLEAAIHDHRFGNPEPKNEAPAKQTPTSHWESPRYEASDNEVLPPVNRLHTSTEGETAQQPLQDSWKAWFDRVTDIEPRTPAPTIMEEPSISGDGEEDATAEEPAISIPIHTVYDLPSELLPRYTPPVESQPAPEPVVHEIEVYREGRGLIRMIQVAGVLMAVGAVALAAVGTGYFDKYILSNSQVSLLAGVSFYNK